MASGSENVSADFTTTVIAAARRIRTRRPTAQSTADFNARRPGYVLSGFNHPIPEDMSQRSLLLKRLSTSRVCEICAKVLAHVIPLPYGHVGCQGCLIRAFLPLP
ncbi:hypothetical protein MTO96_041037 [Rhipicephalus appendiculatus]